MTAEPSLPPLSPAYSLGEEVGRGAFGRVHRGSGPGGFPVAVKLHLEAVDAEALARMQREAKLLQGLEHPGLARFHGLFAGPDGVPALVYEFVPGTSLEQWMEAGRAPPEQAMRWIRGLAEGLDALHQAGVIHRDVKPANVMVTPEGGVKLLDFGLSRTEAKGETLTRTGLIMGTPAYMAPETLTGERLTRAADLYALGCMAFELFTGRLPFEGSPAELVEMHLSQTPPSVRAVDPSLPAGLGPVLNRALAKKPEDRFPDGAALGRALAEAIASSGTVAALTVEVASRADPDSTQLSGERVEVPLRAVKPRAAPGPPPKRSGVPAVLGVLVAGLLVGGWLLVGDRTPERVALRRVPGGLWLTRRASDDPAAVTVKVDGDAYGLPPGTPIFVPGPLGEPRAVETGDGAELVFESRTGVRFRVEDPPLPDGSGAVWVAVDGTLALRVPEEPRPDRLLVQREDWNGEGVGNWKLERNPVEPELYRIPTDEIGTWPATHRAGGRRAVLPPILTAVGHFGPEDLPSKAAPVTFARLTSDSGGDFVRTVDNPCLDEDGNPDDVWTGPILTPDGRIAWVDDAGVLLLFRRDPLRVDLAGLLTEDRGVYPSPVFFAPLAKGGGQLVVPTDSDAAGHAPLPELDGPMIRLPEGVKSRCDPQLRSLRIVGQTPGLRHPAKTGGWNAGRGLLSVPGNEMWVAIAQWKPHLVWAHLDGRFGAVPLPRLSDDYRPLIFPPFQVDGAMVAGYAGRDGPGPAMYVGVDLEKGELRWQLQVEVRPQSPPAPVRGGLAILVAGQLRWFPPEKLRGLITAADGELLRDFGDASINREERYFTAWILGETELGLDLLFWRDRDRKGTDHYEGRDRVYLDRFLAEKQKAVDPEWHRLAPDGSSRELTHLHLGAYGLPENDFGVYHGELLEGGKLALISILSDASEHRLIFLDVPSMSMLSSQLLPPPERTPMGVRKMRRGPLVLPSPKGGYLVYTADQRGTFYEWHAAIGAGTRGTFRVSKQGEQSP